MANYIINSANVHDKNGKHILNVTVTADDGRTVTNDFDYDADLSDQEIITNLEQVVADFNTIVPLVPEKREYSFNIGQEVKVDVVKEPELEPSL